MTIDALDVLNGVTSLCFMGALLIYHYDVEPMAEIPLTSEEPDYDE